MHLTSMTLRGFKSFASATTLNFEPGITCVVGPNGSGKSNVVDALAWVMGEQGAKSLRGGKMEDVIFAGTSGRGALGRAEVELTIDNSDGALPIEYTEVTVKRTMFRNGGSDYQINGQNARLLDVQELLSDSGIGREMHVIVGQGQLDSILQATPEGRRGFIEEAAGVLKHRKRKEKALRKLEATEANLHRVNDLLAEIRRQLKPLGRQAEVARRASVVQADARDARARLLADDVVRARLTLESDLADDATTTRRRAEVEAALAAAREQEAQSEETLRAATPALTRAQERYYELAALRERIATTIQVARERVRAAAEAESETDSGRDPAELDQQAEAAAAEAAELAAAVADAGEALAAATTERAEAEAHAEATEAEHAARLRAAADRREGLARLTGQVNSLRSRTEAAAEEITRLEASRAAAAERAERARVEFTALESSVAGLDDGERGLDAEHDEAQRTAEEAIAALDRARTAEAEAERARAAAGARVEALRLGLDRQDAGSALVAAADRLPGVLGAVADLIEVTPGWETAISAALGASADAVAVADLDAVLAAFDHLRTEDLGRAALLVGATTHAPPRPSGLPEGAVAAVDVVTCPAELRTAVAAVLARTVLVEDATVAKEVLAHDESLVVHTRVGDQLSTWFASGGSARRPSMLEVQAAVDEAEAAHRDTEHAGERATFAVAEARASAEAASAALEAVTQRLHESDARLAAVTEELGRLGSQARAASEEAERAGAAIVTASEAREADLASLAALDERLRAAEAHDGGADDTEPDPAARDAAAETARLARGRETEARLSLRTAEERERAVRARAESLERAAADERRSRRAAEERRARLRRAGALATQVASAADHLVARVERAREDAAAARSAAEESRRDAEGIVRRARERSRELAAELTTLVDATHRVEMARAEQRLRLETLEKRGLDELGIEADALVADFGPDVGVPVQPDPAPDEGEGAVGSGDGDEGAPTTRPYVRAEQEQRLRTAERHLRQLGKVNPLALEEFDAMQERHAFLAEQLDDIRRTRADLAEIIEQVDARVQQVFEEAWVDVEKAFARVFARLFPGGEGRLVLTEPGQWLTTGVDVEARPPGKKVKRLSLLSGGERSLVAVAFLVALFIARPSPFYILDEVEAALDDTNLGRLLEIYEELRESSQLIVITHQKRTMEIGDALYGVTMRGDGVSTVISQRLRGGEPVAAE